MKKNKIIRASKLLWMLLSFLFIGLQSFSQTSTQKITGKIINKTTGSPVAGASISVKNTNNATLSDVAGNFAINAKAGETIVISFIGFITQSITVNRSTENLQIQLIEEYNKLDEVVLIGYGSQQKKFVTGATSQVSGKDLAKLNTTNALQALQGQAAGVNITSVSGQPGGGFKVNIRGAGTIGNASPLYVVDGVITGDITYLNDADIASVDILKDAASCAIYGINGANGVVLITTKSGKSANRKDGQVSFDAYYGVQNVARKADLLNAEQYATIQNEAALNSGKALLFTQSQINALGSGTNWLNQMFSSNVPTQNFNLGINGGSDVSSYSLGLSYTAQGGIVGGSNLSNYQRYNFHTNSERKLYNGALRVGEHLTFSYIDQKGISDGGIYNTTLRGAFTTSPLLAMYDSSGNFLNSMNSTVYNGGPWNNGEANPYALMVYNNQNDTKSQKVLGDVYAELQPFQNMTIKSTFGVEYNSAAGHSYTPAYKNLSIYSYNNYEGIGQSSSQGLTWNWDNTINYLFKIKDHKFDILGGSSIRIYHGSYVGGFNTGSTLFGNFERAYLSNSTVTSVSMSTDTSAANRQTVTNSMSVYGNANAASAHASFFGRINYSFKDKYLASAIFRADGSTVFAPGHQWGYFPSFSAGWVVSNEKFMESIGNWLNFLKVRASWGSNGNDGITAFNYLSLISLYNAQYNFSNTNSTLTNGSYPSTIGVENTKWETSQQTNVGIDAQLLKNRLNISIDVYNKLTKNWLI